MKKRMRILTALCLAAAMGIVPAGCGAQKAPESKTESAAESKTESVTESSAESGPESEPEDAPISEPDGGQGKASGKAQEASLEGKPWINGNLYGNWPETKPGVEESLELNENYDFYKKAAPMGTAEQSTNISRGQAKVLEEMEKLCRDTEKTGPEEESLRILYGYYMGERKPEESFASVMAYVDRVKAVKTPDELTALIKGEDGYIFGEAFLLGFLQPTTSSGKDSLNLALPTILEDIPTEGESTEPPKKDVKGAKERLLRMKFSEEEADQAIGKLQELESNNAREVLSTEEESKLLDKGTLSLKDIQDAQPLVAALIKSQGFVREGAETEPMYELSAGYLESIRKLFTEENLGLLKAMAALTIYKLDPTIAPENTEQTMQSFLNFVPRVVSEQAFVHNCVPKDRVEAYPKLAEEYREAMRERIMKNSWLNEETKKKASAKLDKLVVSDLLYPYGEIDCESLRTGLRGSKNFLEAAAQCRKFGHKCDTQFAGRESRRGNRYETNELTLAVGGKYAPDINTFYIGAASLLDGMYDGTSRETILGSIGAHIGHELSHGYDLFGAQKDADGTAPLFTEQDGKTFAEKGKSIAGKLGKIEMLSGFFVNGERVVNEMLADITGLSLSLDLAKKTENFDYDAMFRAYARFYQCIYRDRKVMTDVFADEVHPVPYSRVNYVVAQFDEFYKTYPSVKEGTPMYIAPEQRELIW